MGSEFGMVTRYGFGNLSLKIDFTYKAKGVTIVCYIEKTEYARYKIHSLLGHIAEMTMTMEGESIDIKCLKR